MKRTHSTLHASSLPIPLPLLQAPLSSPVRHWSALLTRPPRRRSRHSSSPHSASLSTSPSSSSSSPITSSPSPLLQSSPLRSPVRSPFRLSFLRHYGPPSTGAPTAREDTALASTPSKSTSKPSKPPSSPTSKSTPSVFSSADRDALARGDLTSKGGPSGKEISPLPRLLPLAR